MRFFLVAASGSSVGICQLIDSTVDLSVSSSDLEYSVSFSSGGSATARPEMSASLFAMVEWDPETLKVISTRFQPPVFVPGNLGPGIFWDDFSLSVDTTLPPNTPSTWTFDFRDLKVAVFNGSQSGTLLSEDGRLNTEHVSLTTNRGTSTGIVVAQGQELVEIVDYAVSPEPFELSLPPRVRIEKVDSDHLTSDFEFHFDFEFYEEVVENSPELGISITALESGSFTLSGIASLNTRFNAWSYKAGQEFGSLDRGAVSAQGVPIELAYALDLDLGRIDRHKQPIEWISNDGVLTMKVLSGTLNEDIAIEFLSDPATNSWERVPDDWVLLGGGLLSAGFASSIEVTVPEDLGSVLLRLRPDLSEIEIPRELR
ncbi:MAG: hypothetical protein AAGB46_10895 [Verrucomicrobiota bacterium]